MNKKESAWFVCKDNMIYVDAENKILGVPYSLKEEDYNEGIKGLLGAGYTIQLEIK